MGRFRGAWALAKREWHRELTKAEREHYFAQSQRWARKMKVATEHIFQWFGWLVLLSLILFAAKHTRGASSVLLSAVFFALLILASVYVSNAWTERPMSGSMAQMVARRWKWLLVSAMTVWGTGAASFWLAGVLAQIQFNLK